MTRTDVHRPSALVTEDYEYVYAYDSQAPGALVGVDMTWWGEIQANMVRIHEGGRCDHCGAWLRYIAILRHVPTGKYLEVGETCLDNRFSLATADFHRLRKAAELDRAQHRIVAAANDCLEALEGAGIVEGVIAFLRDRKGANDPAGIYYPAVDIRAKLWRYGSISEKQADFVARLVERATAPPPPEEAKVPVPVGPGRLIEGEVIKTEYREGDGYRIRGRLVMTVKITTPVGICLVWGTIPDGIAYDLKRGDTVRFLANIELPRDSDPDGSFGIFKRPRKAEVIKRADA